MAPQKPLGVHAVGGERGTLAPAAVVDQRAAVGEGAAGAEQVQGGTTPGISASGGRRSVGRRLAAQRRDAADQAAGVGVPGVVEDVVGAALLDHAAGVHDGDAVGHLGDGAHVVGDHHDGHAELLLDVAHQVEDLGLHGDVERGGRLVGDQHLRAAGDRHGDHHPLAHAADISWG